MIFKKLTLFYFFCRVIIGQINEVISINYYLAFYPLKIKILIKICDKISQMLLNWYYINWKICKNFLELSNYDGVSIFYCALYTSLCRGLKYLLEVRYVILVYPNVVRFLLFKTFCLGRSKTLPCVRKISQKLTALVFGNT